MVISVISFIPSHSTTATVEEQHHMSNIKLIFLLARKEAINMVEKRELLEKMANEK